MIWHLLTYFSSGLVWVWALNIKVSTNGSGTIEGKHNSTIDNFMKFWVAIAPVIAWPIFVVEVYKSRRK